MEEALARGIQIFAALSVAYLVALWFALAVWAYRDIGARSQSVVTQVVGTLLVVLFSIPGALLYLLLRPKETLDEAYQRSLEEEYLLQDLEEVSVCHSCQRPVEDEFVLCPNCQTALKEACPACARLINVKWSICPYCGTNQSDRVAIIREQLPPTEDRFVERGARTFRPLQPSSTIQPSTFPLPNGDAEEFIGPDYAPPGLEAGEVEAMEATGDEAERTEPIRLFDRRKTRMLRASERSDGAVIENGAAGAPSDGAEPREDSEAASFFNGSDQVRGGGEVDFATADQYTDDAGEAAGSELSLGTTESQSERV